MKLAQFVNIKFLIARYKFLSIIYRVIVGILICYRRKSKIVLNEDIFNYLEISKKTQNDNISIIRDNNLYGIQEVFEKYIGMSFSKIFFEHGMIFGNLVTYNSKHTFAEKIVTFGNYRNQILENHFKNEKGIIKVGPYIHYADNLLSELDFYKLKNELGKVLLLFPSHSTKGLDDQYDIEEFINKAENKVKGTYDTKVVCLYWKDINLGKSAYYLKRGYKITCAGYLNDSNFLSRLKLIIMLADQVVCNSIGTNIGYVTYLNKPICLIRQSHTIKSINAKSFIELNQRNTSEMLSYSEIEDIIFNNFSDYHNNLTPDQTKLCSYIWGFDEIKTAHQLIELFKIENGNTD